MTHEVEGGKEEKWTENEGRDMEVLLRGIGRMFNSDVYAYVTMYAKRYHKSGKNISDYY